MSENNYKLEEEIDVKKIIKVLIDYKWMIFGLSIIFVLVTTIYLISRPKVYESSVVLSAVETSIVSQNGDIQKVGLPASFYESLVLDLGFLTTVSKENNLQISPKKISNSLTIDKDNDPRILKIKFKAVDKNTVSVIMISITEMLLNTNTQLKKGEIVSSEDYIKTQKKTFDSELSLIEKKLTDYQKTANLSLLEQRVKDKLALQSQYELEYSRVTNDIKSEEQNLKEITKHFGNEEKTYKLIRSLSDEVAFQQFASKMTKKEMSDLLTLKLESETLNPLYESLKERLINSTINLANHQVRKTIYENEIKQIEKELELLQTELIEKKKFYDRYNTEYELTKDKYKEFSQREAVTRAYAPLSIGSLSILAPIYISDEPVSQFDFKTIIINGIIGFVIGILLAFLIEFYNNVLKENLR